LKFNVIHLINSFEQGGTERQTVQLVRLLKEHDRFRVRLACLNEHGPLREEAEGLGLGEIRHYPLTSFHDVNFLRQIRRLARDLREQGISVVHAHDYYTNVVGMAAAVLARIPARIASKRDIRGFRTRTEDFVERCSFRLAHRVVANSGAVRDFLVRSGVKAAKIVTLYNGLDMGRIQRPADFNARTVRAELNLPSDRRLVTVVANTHNKVKDHPTFLRAARRVKESVPEAAFVIAGGGPLLEELRAYAASLGLAGDVFFLGKCKRVPELLSLSEVCVLSSQAEGFSNSILEYMAAARPVVATDVGGAREAIIENETGYIVPAGDDNSMAERITRLLKSRDVALAFGGRGRQVVAEKFSCEAQLTAAESLYEELLARRGGIVPAQAQSREVAQRGSA
jgi:glycosyltransferase involved in cell wall biosynthesis